MKRRWIQMRTPPYDLVEVTPDYAPPPDRSKTDSALWGDRGYVNLPPEQGEQVDSRTKHREYMRRHGLTTMDDFADEWQRAEKARDDYRTSGKGGAVTKDDIARAIWKLGGDA